MHFTCVRTSLSAACQLFLTTDVPCFRDVQTRLLMGNFIVNKDSVYKTVEELWDGEV